MTALHPLDPTAPTETSKLYDFVIVGAGVFGSALAVTLAKAGHQVLLVERDFSVPDRIVGELLQPGGCRALKALGLGSCLEGIGGVRVDGYAIFYNGRPVQVSYTRDPETGSKFTGMSFHHGRFVAKLREAARETEGVTLLEATVERLLFCPETNLVKGISCSDKGNGGIEQHHFGKLTVVADGCFSKFRKACTGSTPKTLSHFVGLVLKDCPLPYPNHGHVVLAKEGPILLYQIGADATRILVDVPGKLPSAANGDLEEYLLERVAASLPDQIRPSFVSAVKRHRPRVMPNCMLSPSSLIGSGLIVGGDAFNMRHPLTGGGMTVALTDVVKLRELISTLPSEIPCGPEACLQKAPGRSSSSAVINVLACALYRLFQSENGNWRVLQLFTHRDPSLLRLQEGCFEYFKLGGVCVAGPVGFLSGIDCNLLHLVYHFFRVCLFAQYLQVRAAPVVLKPWAALCSSRLFLKGGQIILPLIYAEFAFLRPKWPGRLSVSHHPIYLLVTILFSLSLLYIAH
ncbi:Squalene epoxidase [Massospora cicadina]|nr:Squalene epoxidase [Massospora cicadina]